MRGHLVPLPISSSSQSGLPPPLKSSSSFFADPLSVNRCFLPKLSEFLYFVFLLISQVAGIVLFPPRSLLRPGGADGYKLQANLHVSFLTRAIPLHNRLVTGIRQVYHAAGQGSISLLRRSVKELPQLLFLPVPCLYATLTPNPPCFTSFFPPLSRKLPAKELPTFPSLFQTVKFTTLPPFLQAPPLTPLLMIIVS